MKILRIPLVMVLIAVAGWAFHADAQTEATLHFFPGPPTDGAFPAARLVQGSDGNLYGTTENGGTSTNCYLGCGTVFRISLNGSYTNLHSFVGSPNEGQLPYAGLVQGNDGNFYGTTYEGGTYNSGTVFRISLNGSYTNLYSFAGPPTEGYNPQAGLVQGSDGNFYGTTVFGGTNSCTCGTVFRISPSGTCTTLYSFGSFPYDGAVPNQLVQGSDGNLYATTSYGGTNSCSCGTVFRISLNGSYTNLYSFAGPPTEGYNPVAGLVQGSDGNFYGTTENGGTSTNCDLGCGTVFRISPSGSYTSLYSFAGYPDAFEPYAGLVQGSDGNFYGASYFGGTNDYGAVFRISPSGTYTTLYSFNGLGGQNPIAGPMQGSDGNFYGTAPFGGGAGNDGTVFKLSVALSSPPNQIARIRLAGTNTIFSISSVAGETYQLQYRNSLTSGSWSNIPVSVTNSIGSILTLTNFGGANQPQGFYRFDITP